MVTIGLNTFNASDTVEAALLSALAQDWPHTEIIIVDDASTDDTISVLRGVAKNRPDVRLLRNRRNLGLASSRNRVIEEARGEFIVFFDDDDVSRPDRVRSQVKRIRDYERRFLGPLLVLCHTARDQVYPFGVNRIERTMGEYESREAPSGKAVAQRILFGRPLRGGYGSCAGCSQAARTSVFRSLGGFDADFRRAEDTEFCVRAARQGAHFVGIKETMVRQRMTHGTDKGLEKERVFRKVVLTKHRDMFYSSEHLEFCLKWTDLRINWLARRRSQFARELAESFCRHPIWTVGRLWEARHQNQGNRAARAFHHDLKP